MASPDDEKWNGNMRYLAAVNPSGPRRLRSPDVGAPITPAYPTPIIDDYVDYSRITLSVCRFRKIPTLKHLSRMERTS
jgi:hypothetical protein